MALVLAPQPAHALAARMTAQSFKGDHDLLLDRLIAASQRREAAVESLQERALVPFFDSCESSATSFQALQPGRRPAATKPMAVPAAPQPAQQPHGLKRGAHERSSPHLSGSPPKKEGEVLQGKHQRRSAKPASPTTSAGSKGAASSGSHSDGEASSSSARKPRSGGSGKAATTGMSTSAPAASAGHSKKHQRVTAATAAGTGVASQRQSPPRKRPELGALDMRQLAAAAASAAPVLRTPSKATRIAPAPSVLASKFAGPAFTNSPTPDSLPIPTSSLLLQEAAEGLRSRLTL